MAQITIMNWNVEQFGTSRVNDVIRLKAVAELIADCNADLNVIIELQAQEIVAVELCNKILKEINNRTKRKFGFILTYYNNLEVYAYFYATDTLIPLALSKGYKRTITKQSEIANLPFINCSDQSTTIQWTINKEKYYSCYFPLIDYPDIEGRRPLGMGLFNIRNTKKIFCVFAWHNESLLQYKVPFVNMQNLAKSEFVQKNKLTVHIENQDVDIEDLIITGDFNVDYLGKTQWLNYLGFLSKNYQVCENEHKSYLMEYDPRNDSISDPLNLRTVLFDNFILSCKNMRMSGRKIVDIPDIIYKNKGLIKRYFIESELATNRYFEHNLSEYMVAFVKKLGNEYTFLNDDHEKICDLMEKIKVVEYTIQNNLLENIEEILEEYIDRDEIVSVIKVEIFIYTSDYSRNVKFYKEKGKGHIMTNYNDCLLITRSFYSDHLPIILKLDY